MNITENILLALAGLKANKMRAILTMLGIIIGIASVIAIVNVGNSLTASISSSMKDMGGNSITINIRERGTGDQIGPSDQSVTAGTPSENDLLSDEAIETFKARFTDRIDTISLSYSSGSGKVQDGRLYANVGVMGVNDGYPKAGNVKLNSGRFITDKDIKTAKKVAVVSDKLVNNMFSEGMEPLGQEIKIYYADKIDTYTIIGVYKYTTSMFDNSSSSSEKDQKTNLFVPVTLAMQDATTNNYQMLTVVTKTGEDAATFTNDIKTYFEKLYANNKKWEAGVTNMESTIASFTAILGSVQLAVAAIAAISLMVGGIGVMNIMLVSVTERTREIGTRKALGARNASIKLQFMVEAVIICLIGGVIGIILGLLMGYLGSMLLGYPAKVSTTIILISVSLTMMIGIFFGYYPANKAAKMDPIDALRYE